MLFNKPILMWYHETKPDERTPEALDFIQDYPRLTAVYGHVDKVKEAVMDIRESLRDELWMRDNPWG